MLARRLPFATVAVFSLVSFFTPGPDLPDLTENVWDKAGHASIFAVLAITGLIALLPWRRLAGGLFGYAVVTEILQATLPIHRSGDWHDVAADSIGIVAGLVIAGVVIRLVPSGAGPSAGR
jgi:hypothetical protein